MYVQKKWSENECMYNDVVCIVLILLKRIDINKQVCTIYNSNNRLVF